LTSTLNRNEYSALWGHGSSVGITTGYELDYRGVGVRVLVGSTIFISLYRPDQLWGPPSLSSNGYWGSFPGDKAVGA
jgi:hypothetical protein